jgi:hypothetical protein
VAVRQPDTIGKGLGFIGKKPFDTGRKLHDISLRFSKADGAIQTISKDCKRAAPSAPALDSASLHYKPPR